LHALCILPFYSSGDLPVPHSFPTRRSSDLARPQSLGLRDQALPEREDAAGRDRFRPPGSPLADVAHGSAPSGGKPGGRNRSRPRSEEHTSELQSRRDLVCRLLLEKKKKKE